MKILIYSDLHLEFGHGWKLPDGLEGDLLVLAGDIISFDDFSPLLTFLNNWEKPVIFTPGNHEFYCQSPIDEACTDFEAWLEVNLPHVTLLNNSSALVEGVHFFGGTMWTDFSRNDVEVLKHALAKFNDFKLIQRSQGKILSPQDVVQLHDGFRNELRDWLQHSQSGPHVVITHHAPITSEQIMPMDDPRLYAYCSTDILELIQEYQPQAWIYGHTHKCCDFLFERTRIISNQMGYPNGLGGYECVGFDARGAPVDL